MSASVKSNNHIQSVDRALSILEFLSKYGESSVTDIASRLDIHKSTAFRLLATLEQRGFVSQELQRGKYRLALGLVHLAGAVTADLELVRLARPICKDLSESTQETVNIAVLEQHSILNIDQVIGSSTVVSFNWLGRRDPINCTSSGKVLLAFLPKQQKNDLAKYGFSNCTQHSYSDPTQLETQLELIRQRGYGYTLEELELGLNAVAAPIFDQNAAVIASICVSGPSYRLSETKIHAVGKLTQQAAQQISEKLGFRGS